MNLLIFERTNLQISEDNKFGLSIRRIGNDNKSFMRFINQLVDLSKNYQTFVNVYRIYKDGSLVKIAWIKAGDLYTL